MVADMRESDEVDSATTRQPRSSGLTLLGLLGGVVLAAVLIGQLTAPAPSPRPPAAVATPTATDRATTIEPDVPIGVESLTPCTVHMGGLTLGDHLQIPGYPLERWDCDAPPKGPWSVVIRAAGGHFGVQSAVVTFPIDPVRGGVPSTKPEGGMWNPGAQMLVWPLGSSHAQIVGDLGQAALEDLATRITVANHRPHFAGLDGFAVAGIPNYGSPVVHEMRYSPVDLRQKSTLGDGLVFTGVTWAASFETLAFQIHAESSGFVRGKPAVYSSDLGGSGTLAWESAPGEVTYIGYSGALSSPKAMNALRALADKGRMLTPAQWETLSPGLTNAQPGTSP